MNRKILLTFIIMVFALTFTGCGGNDSGSSYEDSPYRHVLNEYVLFAESGYDFDDTVIPYYISEKEAAFFQLPEGIELEYAHVNLKGDNTPALIIAHVNHEKFDAAKDDPEKLEESYTIFDIWLTKEGFNPYSIITGSVDNSYMFCEGGYIQERISEADEEIVEYISYSPKKEYVFEASEGAAYLEYDDKYYKYTLNFENDPVEITADEFIEFCDKYPPASEIEWKPLLTEENLAIVQEDVEKTDEIYEPIKEDYRKQIEKIFAESKDGSTDGVKDIDLMFTSNYDSADGDIEGSKDFSTAYADIDTNGAMELFVFAGGELNAIWTHDGKKAIKLLDLVGTEKDFPIMRYTGISRIFIGGPKAELLEVDENMGAGVYDPYRYYDEEYFVYSIQNGFELEEREHYTVDGNTALDKERNYMDADEWGEVYFHYAFGDDVEMIYSGGHGSIDPDYRAYDEFDVIPLF